MLVRAALCAHVRSVADRDPVFAARLAALWAEVQLKGGGVTNSVSGTTYGPVVQAGTVYGGVSFGSAAYPAPAQRRPGG